MLDTQEQEHEPDLDSTSTAALTFITTQTGLTELRPARIDYIEDFNENNADHTTLPLAYPVDVFSNSYQLQFGQTRRLLPENANYRVINVIPHNKGTEFRAIIAREAPAKIEYINFIAS